MGYFTRRRSSHALQQHHAFLPAVVRSWSPETEGDFNFYKSNLTGINDLSIYWENRGPLRSEHLLFNLPLRSYIATQTMAGDIRWILWCRRVIRGRTSPVVKMNYPYHSAPGGRIFTSDEDRGSVTRPKAIWVMDQTPG
jgi:hypothetical protein